MRRIVFTCLVLLLAEMHSGHAFAQGYPAAGFRPSPAAAAARSSTKKFPRAAGSETGQGGVQGLRRGHEEHGEGEGARGYDREEHGSRQEGQALAKLDDTYGRALEEFTEVLRNKSDMYDPWNKIGFIHLHFAAYRESIDDYNHALALKPDLQEAIEHRGEAFMGIDHLDEAKAAYMDLFFHDRPLADQMMTTMQAWLQSHRASANGVRAADIDAFDKWLQERDGIAKTTAAN